jgi:hypothetical protein
VLDCSPGATCQLKCGNNVGNSCTLHCHSASCLIDCGANAQDCTLDCSGGSVMSCPGDVKVCGRACP